jgi:hypothetical protein
MVRLALLHLLQSDLRRQCSYPLPIFPRAAVTPSLPEGLLSR